MLPDIDQNQTSYKIDSPRPCVNVSLLQESLTGSKHVCHLNPGLVLVSNILPQFKVENGK